MTERELFAAYRRADHWEAECACGELIVSAGTATVEEAVAVHNASAIHGQWREWQDAVRALQRPTRHPCPCSGDAA